jgi:hypothetical protein
MKPLSRQRAAQEATGCGFLQLRFIADIEIRLERWGGLARGQAQRAADRVLAEQRFLRTAQHLDTFQVQEIEARLRTATAIHTIDIGRHRLLEARHFAGEDAADVDLVADRVLHDREIRHQAGQLFQVLDAGFFDRSA